MLNSDSIYKLETIDSLHITCWLNMEDKEISHEMRDIVISVQLTMVPSRTNTIL